MFRRTVAATIALSLGAVVGVLGAAPAQASNKTYANCTALNKDYKHGVGKSGAHDHTSGTPVKNFYVSTTIYNKNTKSDRDKDGIACEKK